MTLRCIHRQDFEHHPACFLNGKVDYKSEKEFIAVTGKNWWERPGTKIGYLDIESDGLRVDFSTMLSWAIKERGGATTYNVITKEELFSECTDQRLVQNIINEIKKYRVIVTYFGTIFDNTFIRAKALHYGMEFPGFGSSEDSIYHFDLYYTAKSKLASLSSKRLENVCDYLGIEGKTPLAKEMWRRAKYGDETALSYIVAHNIADTEILEQVHNRLAPFSKFTKKSI